MSECGICYDGYTDPRVLPCGHSCCKQCIQQVINAIGAQCPFCKSRFTVADNNANNLPRNFSLMTAIDQAKATELCSVHQEAAIYCCTTCQTIACAKCVVDTTHRSHMFEAYETFHRKLADERDLLTDPLLQLVQQVKSCENTGLQSFKNALQANLAAYGELIQLLVSASVQFQVSSQLQLDSTSYVTDRTQLETLLDETKRLSANLSTVGDQGLVTVAKRLPEMRTLVDQLEQSVDSAIDSNQCAFVHRTALENLAAFRTRLDELLGDSDSQSATASIGGNSAELLLCIGGDQLDLVEAFSPVLQRWFALQNTHYERSSAAAAVLNGKVVVCGGRSLQARNKVEQFDLESNRWTKLANMNRGRLCHALVNSNGTLYAIGGYRFQSKSVERYHADLNKWELIDDLIIGREGLMAAALDIGIVIAGGVYDDSETLKSCELLDSSSLQWRSIASLNTARKRAAAATHNGQMFVFGGEDSNDSILDDVEQFDGRVPNSLWVTLRNRMLVPRSSFAASCVNGKVYLVGGIRGYQSLECFHPDVRCFTHVATPLSSHRYSHAVASLTVSDLRIILPNINV